MKYLFLLAWLLVPRIETSAAAAHKPNILLIYADDLGYGDVSSYNPDRGKIPTPHIDKLAAQGMRFTDGHSSSAVCSPSRYTLLTGRYHWRSSLQRGIVGQGERFQLPAGPLEVRSVGNGIRRIAHDKRTDSCAVHVQRRIRRGKHNGVRK